MDKTNRNTSIDFLEALESLKQARLVTHTFMTHEHQFNGLTEAEQNSFKTVSHHFSIQFSKSKTEYYLGIANFIQIFQMTTI